MRVHPRRVLIILHGSIGDVTRALPLANSVRHGYPEAKIAWAVEPQAFPLVEHHPAVDGVILSERECCGKSLPPALRRIGSKRFAHRSRSNRITSSTAGWCSKLFCSSVS